MKSTLRYQEMVYVKGRTSPVASLHYEPEPGRMKFEVFICTPGEGFSADQFMMEGSLSREGCLDLDLRGFDDGGIFHFCGKTHANTMGRVIDRIYSLGRYLIPHWDPDTAE